MKPVEKLLTVAKAEEGYLEKQSNHMLDDKEANAGNKNYTKYAKDKCGTNDWLFQCLYTDFCTEI